MVARLAMLVVLVCAAILAARHERKTRPQLFRKPYALDDIIVRITADTSAFVRKMGEAMLPTMTEVARAYGRTMQQMGDVARRFGESLERNDRARRMVRTITAAALELRGQGVTVDDMVIAIAPDDLACIDELYSGRGAASTRDPGSGIAWLFGTRVKLSPNAFTGVPLVYRERTQTR